MFTYKIPDDYIEIDDVCARMGWIYDKEKSEIKVKDDKELKIAQWIFR